DISDTTVTAVVWPDYSPTPNLSKWFRGRKERDSEKKDWLAYASLEYSLNRLPRMGVPGNGNNLSHGTSPQVPSTGRKTSVDRTRELAQVMTPKSIAISLQPARPSRPDRDLHERRDLVTTGQARCHATTTTPTLRCLLGLLLLRRLLGVLLLLLVRLVLLRLRKLLSLLLVLSPLLLTRCLLLRRVLVLRRLLSVLHWLLLLQGFPMGQSLLKWPGKPQCCRNCSSQRKWKSYYRGYPLDAGGGLRHGLSQGGTHVCRHTPPQVWSQSCYEPLCTRLIAACDMRHMPQQPDKPLVVLRNCEVVLNQRMELVPSLTSSVVEEVLAMEDLRKPLPSDVIQPLPLEVSLPLNSPPLKGCSLELVHCQSNLVLLSALHGLEDVLQLMGPALCLVWIILTVEHRWSKVQEPLKESGPVLRNRRPLPPGSGTPSARPLLTLWLLHLWLYLLLRHHWRRYRKLNTCCCLPGLVHSLVQVPKELLC
ncbi:hypothetical protein Taro_009120, partial [Colocasia esculenta]|nr:hypothetical protein [Colocasia esculenta]